MHVQIGRDSQFRTHFQCFSGLGIDAWRDVDQREMMISNNFARAIRCRRFGRGFRDSLEPMDLDLYHSIVVSEIYTIRNSYIHQVKPAVSLKLEINVFKLTGQQNKCTWGKNLPLPPVIWQWSCTELSRFKCYHQPAFLKQGKIRKLQPVTHNEWWFHIPERACLLFCFQSLLFWFICSRIRPARNRIRPAWIELTKTQKTDVTPSSTRIQRRSSIRRLFAGFIPQWFTLLLD